jgi:dTDP-4-dehydrorhamnose reductase
MMDAVRRSPAPLEMWGGVECTVNRVHDRWFDQIERSGHHSRASDLERFAELGISALRYPILWERLAPRSLDEIDWQWADERMALLRQLAIRPIVGLVHHGSGPAYTSLLDDEFPGKLARFARAVAERYPWVTDFTPINEPLTTARFSGLYGHWYPHARDDRAFIRALLIQMRGIVQAMRAIREVTPHACLVQTEDCGATFGTPVTARQADHEAHRRWLTWDLLTGRVDARHPLAQDLVDAGATASDVAFFADVPCPPDVAGLNYYLTSDRYLDERLERYPAWSHGGNGELTYADVEAVRARTAGIIGHEEHLYAAWERYRLPVAITEVHLGCTREDQMRWLVESWQGACRARDRGADVTAVTAWGMVGSHDWDSLVTREALHYEPGVYDVRAPAPRPTALASLVRTLASGGVPSHPVLGSAGWWRRAARFTDAARGPARGPISASSPPILIIGATGTLGRAFQRISTERGLPSQLVGRQEADIADAIRIDALIRRIRPWAVINAAGYVRVDDAERDGGACRRANVTGPVNLAAACRRRGLPLVTFSSDLVFDGRAGRPYTEQDTPNPLNVYGASKAEAERRVLELMPEALVIRTSAFFSAWDDHNFLARLIRTLDTGTSFLAADDSVVSPTYVPDLVHATLDLLIDGERGIWHLANRGETTWCEFARAAARACNRSIDLIYPVPTAEAWPALRPSYSALSSNRGWIMPTLEEGLAAWFVSRDIDVRAGHTCASS